MKKIVFTGGHHTSALVLAQALQNEGFEIIWLGHKYTMKGVKNVSLEWQEVTKAGIKFMELKTGKIHQGSVGDWLRLLWGVFQSFGLLLEIRPDLIVSFGGYLAVPVVLAGFFLGFPSVTHEQTVTAGMANRFLSLLVKRVYLTWPESAKFFPKNKIRLVGLPLRKSILQAREKGLMPRKRLILITGGKQGAQALNQAVMAILPQLLKDFQVVHQTGETSTTKDYEKAMACRDQLPGNLRNRYRAVTYLSEGEMTRILLEASCVVSRAGAHTIYELLILAKPAVVIPLPFSFAREQEQNAQKLARAGLGLVLNQNTMTPLLLLTAIHQQASLFEGRIRESWRDIQGQIQLNATEVMVDEIQKLTTKP